MSQGLIKLCNQNDEIVFDLRGKAPNANEISVTPIEKAGRQWVLKIWCDPSIKIRQFRNVSLGGTERRELTPKSKIP